MDDTKFAILFIVTAVLGTLMFWFFVKKMIQVLKRFLPKTSSDKFVDKSKINELTEEFDGIVRKLEFEREQLHARTKGLFKRSFFRAWFLMGATTVLLAVGLSSEGDDLTAAIIGPLLITALLSLMGAGLYTIVRKEHNRAKFARLLKQELVSKIVTFVNPELNFLDKGILIMSL